MQIADARAQFLAVRIAFDELEGLPADAQDAYLRRLQSLDPKTADALGSLLLAERAADTDVMRPPGVSHLAAELASAPSRAASGIPSHEDGSAALISFENLDVTPDDRDGHGGFGIIDFGDVADARFRPIFTAPQVVPAKYRLLRLLGAGGMGEVFEAEQRMPRRRVAVKLLRRGARSPGLLRRFEFEMDILARMVHPGIAKIYDAGIVGDATTGRPFYVMELVDGIPIDQFVHQRNLGIREIVALLIDVADAVHHAHSRGVTHRDLKPPNIFVDVTGAVRVLDFGIARVASRTSPLHRISQDGRSHPELDGGRTSESRSEFGGDRGAATEVGTIVGTPNYMSPEQACGKTDEVDTSSDVYALGVIAYELLCGKHPFASSEKSVDDVLNLVRQNRPPRPKALRRKLRGDLDAIISRAMATDRTVRYADAGAIAADLRAHLACRPINARARSPINVAFKFTRRNWIALASAIAVGVVAMIVLAPYALHRRFALRVDRIKPGEARLVWEDAQRTETGFSVEFLFEDRWEPLGLELPANTTSKVISSLRPSTTYNFRVRARGPLGVIGTSDIATIVTPASTLSPPSHLEIAESKPTSVRLMWKPSEAPDVSTCAIEFTDNGSRTMAKLVDLDPQASEFTIGELHPNTTYGFRIAIEAGGERAVSNIVRYRTPSVGAKGENGSK